MVLKGAIKPNNQQGIGIKSLHKIGTLLSRIKNKNYAVEQQPFTKFEGIV